LNGVFTVYEARNAYHFLSQHGTVACQYFNSEWTDYDRPGRPTRRIWNMQIWTLLPELATRQEATDRCKALGTDAASEMYVFERSWHAHHEGLRWLRRRVI